MAGRTTKILFSIAVALLLLKCGVSAFVYLWPKSEPFGGGGAVAAQELIQLTNDYRRGLGLNELVVNPRLTQAAVSKARDILAGQYFSHTSPEGKKFSDWVKEVNYAYFYVGENLAIDFDNPQDIFDAWLKSPKHRENIERKEFQEIGIADLSGRFNGRQTDVVVQLFGSRVLGENELSTSSANQQLARNYFSVDGLSAIDIAGSINRNLDYAIFAAIIILALAFIVGRLRRKKIPSPPATESVAPKITAPATKSAKPLKSLYTRQTPPASGRSRTAKNT